MAVVRAGDFNSSLRKMVGVLGVSKKGAAGSPQGGQDSCDSSLGGKPVGTDTPRTHESGARTEHRRRGPWEIPSSAFIRGFRQQAGIRLLLQGGNGLRALLASLASNFLVRSQNFRTSLFPPAPSSASSLWGVGQR